MLFCSYQFLVFFVIVFSLYWATPNRPLRLLRWTVPGDRLRVWLLLVASYIFYASWNKWLALIIFASTTLDFFLAKGIVALQTPRARKFLVAISVTANLGLLCYFKYANFFMASLQQALQATGSEVSFGLLQVLLPIGISFYTFEAINYIVDVYRGNVKPEKNLANFLLFVLFFPHLVAGPIVRARDFLPQVHRRKNFNWMRAQVGVQLFLLGLCKKWVIADRMALFVDPVFKDPLAYKTGAAWIALFAYAMQIYCDFSGYTDMALGTAHLLGYHLSVNFNMPYLARNISEFWRRWHISLSSWLRDYLFIPLGGSRGGLSSTCRNLLITMTLGGLWHGASWNFILWGVIHGLLLIGHRLFQIYCEKRPWLSAALQTYPGTVFRVACTFLCVCLCWVFFRAQTSVEEEVKTLAELSANSAASFQLTWAFFHRLFIPTSVGLGEPLPATVFGFFLALVVLAHILGQEKRWEKLANFMPAPMLGTCYALMLTFALVLAPNSGKAFIYFQF